MKLIHVLDIHGNRYEPTYPKRAKGLVKKGRARFVDAQTICLTCPPLSEEETAMTTSETTPSAAMNLTAAQIFAELQQIRTDAQHISLALEKLEKVPTDGDCQTAATEKIAAISQVIQQREETNRSLIQLYEKMYDDIYYKEETTSL